MDFNFIQKLSFRTLFGKRCLWDYFAGILAACIERDHFIAFREPAFSQVFAALISGIILESDGGSRHKRRPFNVGNISWSCDDLVLDNFWNDNLRPLRSRSHVN